MKKRRVVITGLGCVSPLGLNTKETWKNMLASVSGTTAITLFDASAMDTRIAAEVKSFALHPLVPDKFRRLLSRSSSFGLNASIEAVLDAGLRIGDEEDEPDADLGIAMGCGLIYPELEEFIEIFEDYFGEGSGRTGSLVGPMDTLRRSSITGAALMARLFRAGGPMYTINTACASSAHSIGTAYRAVQSGEAEMMIAGGYDSMINYIDVMGFSLLGALSTRNEQPDKASRPFDRNRDGFVIGEGAAVVVLEELEHALQRGAKIYAEVVGYSSTMNAYRITDSPPDGGECITVMTRAMAEAGLKPEEIDYIAVHGTSTPYNDYSETMAIRAALGEAAERTAISSVKSMVGHMTNASGGMNVIAAVLAIRDQMLPPTINYETMDPKLTLDCVPNKARAAKVEHALANAFAFGGTNACIAVAKYSERQV